MQRLPSWAPQQHASTMSTAKRRRGHSLHLDLPNGAAEELPQIAALFKILFDVKAG